MLAVATNRRAPGCRACSLADCRTYVGCGEDRNQRGVSAWSEHRSSPGPDLHHRGARKWEIHTCRGHAVCALRPLQRAEAMRRPDSSKSGGWALVAITAFADGSSRYTIKRGLKQDPVLLTSDGRAINTVDLDRGTFLP